MRGEVLSVDGPSGSGLISGDDGVRYRFTRQSMIAAELPAAGDQVDFVVQGDLAAHMVVLRAHIEPNPAGWGNDQRSAPTPSLSPWGYFIRCCTRAYFEGEGRARRTEYWSFQLIHAAVLFVLAVIGILTAVALTPGGQTDDSSGVAIVAVMGLWCLLALYFFIPTITALIRRLHDMGQSGAWVLLLFVPFGGFALFVMSLMPSQPGPNRYGAYPN